MEKKPLSQEELQQESGQELPDRHTMSLLNANLAAPLNAAVAANALSDGSIASASGDQATQIGQSTEPPGPPPLF
jgi:hypothetical protein